MTEKGCDNCYYTYFDEKAYPCSLCIRGIERTDQWQPSKKTKADRKTEPKPCEWCKFYDGENCFSQEPCKVMLYLKTEPQTVDWGKREPCTLELFDDDGNYIEPKTEPQTITMVKDHGRKQALEMIGLYHKLKDETQEREGE